MADAARGIMLPRVLLVFLVAHLEMKETRGFSDHLNIANYRRHLGAGRGATFSMPPFASSNTSIFNGALIRSLHPLLLYEGDHIVLIHCQRRGFPTMSA